MSLRISVKSDVKEVTRYLSRTQKKQIPFATKNALDQTAFAVRKEERRQIVKKLDRPKPFTVNGFLVNKSKKTKLIATVFIRDEVWEYLKYSIQGGEKRPVRRFLPIAVNAALDRFGNIKGRKRGPKTKKQFVADIRGVIGVWERTSRHRVKLLIYYGRSSTYKPRFAYYKIGAAIVRAKFVPFFNAQLRRALKSAR